MIDAIGQKINKGDLVVSPRSAPLRFKYSVVLEIGRKFYGKVPYNRIRIANAVQGSAGFASRMGVVRDTMPDAVIKIPQVPLLVRQPLKEAYDLYWSIGRV